MTDDLDTLLQKLPRRTAPASLRARIERMHVRRREPRNIAIALAVIAFVAVILFVSRRTNQASPESPLVAEAINDHLRVLYASHPLEIESGGIHQVKPWFEGRLDFAPIVTFDGDADFPLQGGTIAYYIDRKAAAFVYKRNLHLITLFVFQSRQLMSDIAAVLEIALQRKRCIGFRGEAAEQDQIFAPAGDADRLADRS